MKKRFFSEHIIEFLDCSLIKNKKVLMIGDNIEQSHLTNGRNITYLKDGLLDYNTNEVFDYIIFWGSLNYEENLYEIFNAVRRLMHTDSKVFIVEVNPFILLILKVFRLAGLPTPRLERNMLYLCDLENLINIFGFDILDKGYRFLIPFRIFGIGSIINSFFCRTKFLRYFCFGQYIVFRLPNFESNKKKLSCSIVVPCHNEEDNIKECISRIPNFGLWREIIIVNDGSTDNTQDVVKEIIKERADIQFISYKENRGKGYAVNKGWQQSKGDVFMMLDCDCTTPPEELILFHDAMERGAEFINGTRLIYPREKGSIPFLNRLGVSFFAHLISWITQKRITDPFCGTKAFLRKHWDCFNIKEYLWGDWDLFFTAARYRMKMLELPIHYKIRRYGKTKMRPIKHGLVLFMKSVEGLNIIK